jgi:hypothetical protein
MANLRWLVEILHEGVKDSSQLLQEQEEDQMTGRSLLLALAACGSVLVSASVVQPAIAQETHQVGEMTLTSEEATEVFKKNYSPYGGRGFPTQVFWGDTHLHTSNSLDAKAGGVLLGRRFARPTASWSSCLVLSTFSWSRTTPTPWAP